jgi:NB-ARC domain
MDIAEALKIADDLVFRSRNKHLNDLERSIVEGVCEGKKYSQIATDNHCEQCHINDVAANLWKVISDALGEQVKKANFRSTIQRHQYKNVSSSFVEQISLVNVCSEITLNNHPHHNNPPTKSTTTSTQYLKTIPDLVPIYDRTPELNSLKTWITAEQCRLIVVHGTIGIGKTALARQLLENLKGDFDEIVWQSLSCQRSLIEFIDRNLIASLQVDHLPEPPLDLEARLSLLIEHFRQHRCLVILDDVDRLFSSGELAGNYTEQYQEYRELFRRIWETNHHSCVLLLSREEPSELAVAIGNNSALRSLPLSGLGAGGREIFQAKGLKDEDHWDHAIEHLGGHPSYLESIAIVINKLFSGKVSEFCKYESLFLTEEIKSILNYQLQRLSQSETVVIQALATESTSANISQLLESLQMQPSDVSNALRSLGRRGLIKLTATDDSTFFSLQPIIQQFLSTT